MNGSRFLPCFYWCTNSFVMYWILHYRQIYLVFAVFIHNSGYFRYQVRVVLTMLLWDVVQCRLTDVCHLSEESIAFIFRVEA